MKRLSLILLLLLSNITTIAIAQHEKKMKEEGVVEGVIFKNGEEIHVYMKRMGGSYSDTDGYSAPWQFQSKIKFIPKDVFEKTEKIKNKHYEKYEAKNCDGYQYETLIFESVKYADMSAVGVGMIPKKMFMKKVLDDKISLFHYYDTPPSIGIYEANEYEKMLKDCATAKYVYRIGEKGKLKLVNDLNIKKELADCPMVIEKQSKGEYKVVGKKSSGFNKLLNNSVYKEEVRLIAIEDYNRNCK